MRIVHLIPSLAIGGAEKFVIDLANEQIKTDDVYIVSLYKNSNNLLKNANEKIKVIELNKKIGLDIRIFFRIKKTIEDLKPDVIHSHLLAINYCFFAYIKKDHCLRIHTIHNRPDTQVRNGFEKILKRFMFKYLSVKPILIASNFKKGAYDVFKIQGCNVVINGCKTPKKTSQFIEIKSELDSIRNSGYKIITNVARMSRVKNQLMLVRCVKELNKMGYKTHLILLGGWTTDDGKLIYEEISSMNLSYITLKGYVNNPTDYLFASDGFCLSSEYEGSPISLLEAMGVGCTPVCTPVGCIPEIISNGINGFISSSCSFDDYYKSLVEFHKSDIDKNKVIEYFKNYLTVEKVSKKYFEIYNYKK